MTTATATFQQVSERLSRRSVGSDTWHIVIETTPRLGGSRAASKREDRRIYREGGKDTKSAGRPSTPRTWQCPVLPPSSPVLQRVRQDMDTTGKAMPSVEDDAQRRDGRIHDHSAGRWLEVQVGVKHCFAGLTSTGRTRGRRVLPSTATPQWSGGVGVRAWTTHDHCHGDCEFRTRLAVTARRSDGSNKGDQDQVAIHMYLVQGAANESHETSNGKAWCGIPTSDTYDDDGYFCTGYRTMSRRCVGSSDRWHIVIETTQSRRGNGSKQQKGSADSTWGWQGHQVDGPTMHPTNMALSSTSLLWWTVMFTACRGDHHILAKPTTFVQRYIRRLEERWEKHMA